MPGQRLSTTRERRWCRPLGSFVAGLLWTSIACAQAAAKPLVFDLLAFNVQGNTVLSAAEIERAVYPFLGPDKSLADAEAARAALERAYQSRGYLSVVVALPPQTLQASELTLEVVEAQVAQRRITGSQYHLPSQIAAQTPSLDPGTVPQFEQMQAELSRAQASGDVQITPVITPGDDARKLGVELKIQDSLPLHGQIELNSKQSFNTEQGRLEAGLRYDNLFQRQHSLGLNWIYSPAAPSEANTWVLSYALPLGGDARVAPDRLSLSLVSSSSQTPSSLGGATVVRGESLGLRYRMPLRAADPQLNHGWALGLDWKNNRDSSRDAQGQTTPSAGLRYPVWSVAYDQMVQHSDSRSLRWDVGLALGFSGLGARTVDCNGRSLDQFECKRAGASPSFQILRGNLAWQGAVFGKWQASLQAQWQLAPHPLASGEQLGAGGVDSVRGYYEFEQVGDQGLILRSELTTPAWRPLDNAGLNGVVFVEGARLRVNEALPAEQKNIQMASAGLGLRVRGPRGLRARLDLAVPLQRTLKADSSGSLVPASGQASRNDQRWDFSVRYDF